jgi:hypothetical protein
VDEYCTNLYDGEQRNRASDGPGTKGLGENDMVRGSMHVGSSLFTLIEFCRVSGSSILRAISPPYPSHRYVQQPFPNKFLAKVSPLFRGTWRLHMQGGGLIGKLRSFAGSDHPVPRKIWAL